MSASRGAVLTPLPNRSATRSASTAGQPGTSAMNGFTTLDSPYPSAMSGRLRRRRSESRPDATLTSEAVASASDSIRPIALTGACSTFARKSGSTG